MIKRFALGGRSEPVVLSVVLSLILLFPAVAKAQNRMSAADGVKAALNRFAESYGKKDLNGIMSLFADDPGIVAIGLCEQKAAVGPKAVKKLFERELAGTEGATELPFEILSIDHFGLTAWLTANVYPCSVMNNGTGGKGLQGRLTLMLKKCKGRWRFLQVHFSVPSDRESTRRLQSICGNKGAIAQQGQGTCGLCAR